MLTKWKWCVGMTLALLWASQAGAAAPRMRMCAMDIEYPPFGTVDGTGHLQYLTYQTAKRINLDVVRHIAPRRRCLEEIRSGLSDGMAGAYSPQRAEHAVFPMARGEVDASKALGVITFRVYRRTGSALDWDGHRFRELGDKRLGVQAGFTYVTDRFAQLGVRYDDGAKALEPTFAKLAAGRVEGVVAMMEEADALVARRYPGQVERTSKVFGQTPVYLLVSRQYYRSNQKLVERYWEALRSYRASYEYRRYQLDHP